MIQQNIMCVNRKVVNALKFSKITIISSTIVFLSLILIGFNLLPNLAAFTFLISSIALIINVVTAVVVKEQKKIKKVINGILSLFGISIALFIALAIAVPKTEIPNQDTASETVSEIESKNEPKITSEIESSKIESMIDSSVVEVYNFKLSKTESKITPSRAESTDELKVTSSASESKIESKVESNSSSKKESKIESQSKVTSKTESKTTNSESKAESELVIISSTPALSNYTFIVNTDTNCFHSKECYTSKRILDENRLEVTVSAYSLHEAIELMKANGYDYCGICGKKTK